MDRADLGRANQLYQEINRITQAILNFEHGGRIVAMTVSPGELQPLEPPDPDAPDDIEPEPQPVLVTVSVATQTIEYPPAMVSGIVAALRDRLGVIHDTLVGMGISGLDRGP